MLLATGVSAALLAASIDTTPAMLLLRSSLLQELQLRRSFSPSCIQRFHTTISTSAPVEGNSEP